MGKDTENLNVSLELGRRWLERHEVPAGPGVRCFRVSVAGEPFELRLDHRPDPAPHAGGLPEDPRAASNQEVLLAVARAFLGSLVEYPRPEPDLERGWEAYRHHLLETHGFVFCPPWREMSSEHREAVACLVREAGGEVAGGSVASGSVASGQWPVVSEQPPALAKRYRCWCSAWTEIFADGTIHQGCSHEPGAKLTFGVPDDEPEDAGEEDPAGLLAKVQDLLEQDRLTGGDFKERLMANLEAAEAVALSGPSTLNSQLSTSDEGGAR